MAITEPGMWDAGVAQQAAELPCWAGLAATVGKDLVNVIRAVTDAVTRAEAACRWWALPILGARLHLWSTESVRSLMPPQQSPGTPHSPLASLQFQDHTNSTSL